MTTKSTAFNYKDCEKLDGRLVNAYVEAHLNKEDLSDLVIETSWGDSVVDLTYAVRAAETVTSLDLSENALEYIAEDGHVDCIYGEDLSRIISMQLLKDVDTDVAPTNGDAYIYDENKQKFVTFNLSQALGSLTDTVTNFNSVINNLRSRIVTLEEKTTPPENAPSDVKIAFGNINNYGDYTNANLRTSGIYTHDPTQTVPNDQYFS